MIHFAKRWRIGSRSYLCRSLFIYYFRQFQRVLFRRSLDPGRRPPPPPDHVKYR